MAEEEFSFNLQEYFKVDTDEQHQLKAAIAHENRKIDDECKSHTDKSEKQQRELKVELIEASTSLTELNDKLSDSGGNQYLNQVRRGGVLCCSNQYGLVYLAKKRDLYIIPIASLEAREEIKPVRSFPSDITQIALSSSDLFVSICLIDSIDIRSSAVATKCKCPLDTTTVCFHLFLCISYICVLT